MRIEFHSRRAYQTDLESENDYPLIIPPVHSKDLTRCAPYFKLQTQKALHALTHAKRVLLIGCALNPIDRHFLSLIRLATHRRASEMTLRSQLPSWYIFDRINEPAKRLDREFGIKAQYFSGSWIDRWDDLIAVLGS